MARHSSITTAANSTANLGPDYVDTYRRYYHPDLRADIAACVNANAQPQSHLMGLLRIERQHLANPHLNNSDTALNGGESRFHG